MVAGSSPVRLASRAGFRRPFSICGPRRGCGQGGGSRRPRPRRCEFQFPSTSNVRSAVDALPRGRVGIVARTGGHGPGAWPYVGGSFSPVAHKIVRSWVDGDHRRRYTCIMTQVRKRRPPSTPKQAAACRGPVDELLDPVLFRAISDPTRAALLACIAKCGRGCSVGEVMRLYCNVSGQRSDS